MILEGFLVGGLAYVLGSLPLGYALYKRTGHHPKDVSVYNLGIQNVVKLLGMQAVVLSFLGDFAKGLAAVLLASLWDTNLAFYAGLGVCVGHLYPLWLIQGPPPRGRGYSVLLGMCVAIMGVFPAWQAWVFPILALGVVLALTRYVVFSVVVALATWIVLVGPVQPSLWVLFALFAWRSKESFGRILDGTEPRLGESIPFEGAPNQAIAAFMIHPMTPEDLWKAGRFAWMKPLAKHLPQAWIDFFCEHMRPMKVDEIRGVRTSTGTEIRTYLITVPLLPEVIAAKPDLAVSKAIQAARLAKELGASTFGLGAFWSTIGNKGLDVQAAVPEICVTNGGAYTAGTIKAAIPAILKHLQKEGRNLREVTAAVVGANGVVAFGIARTIAPQVGRVILVGRDMERLLRSHATLVKAYPKTEFLATCDMDDLRPADLVFTATSDPNPVIFAQHVREGTWIFDEGRPADVDVSVYNVPGVRVIPGGVVRPPGNMTQRLDIHFGQGQVPACLAETLIIAANRSFDRKSLGPQTTQDNVQYFVDEAERLGFTVVD